MYKISLALCLFFALIPNLQAQSDVSQSRWKSQEIVIDGNDHEWTKPLNFYDDKTGLLFAISNDSRNLYFAFTLNDVMKMRRLMSAGWSVTFSSKEKKKKFNASLTFPGIKISGMSNRGAGAFEKKASGNPMIKEYQSQLHSILLKGFLSGQTELRLNEHHGIEVAVGTNKEEHIFYEIAIPLKELVAENFIDLDELITLNITADAMERPSYGGGQGGGRQGRSSGMQGGEMSDRGSGGYGGSMGGMGGGRSGGGMGGRPGGMSHGGGYGGNNLAGQGNPFEKVSFKQKFRLNNNKAIR